MGVPSAVLCLVLALDAVLCYQLCPTNFSAAEPVESQFFGDHFIQFTTTDGEYELRNVIKYREMRVIQEDENTTELCVAFHDTTSYTRRDGDGENMAWVTFNTDPGQAAAVVSVQTDCWLSSRSMETCDPVFHPLPGVRTTPLYVYSPLSAGFWDHLKDENVFTKDWVNKMNIQTKQGNIPSWWVPGLQFTSLHYLQIKGNDWGRPDSLLGSLPALKRLDLTDNNLQELPRDIFNGVPKLQDFLLAQNNMSVFPQGLDSLPSLSLLDITNPKGRAELRISDEDLSTIKKVRVIGLENINLRTNVTNMIQLPNLHFLNLSGCSLRQLDDLDIELVKQNVSQQINVLDLSKNNIANLPNNLLSTLKKVRVLYLQDNELQIFPPLQDIAQLSHLDLSKNLISELNLSCFGSGGKDLVHLDLSENEIAHLKDNIDDYLPRLKVLKLSKNKITSISSNVFIGLDKLKTLDLSQNLLSMYIYFENMKLDEVNLSNNKFKNLSTFITSDTTIKKLSLSHNNISEWSSFASVQVLNLSYNAFSEFTQDMADHFNELLKIDLGENPFDCCADNFTILKSWLRSTEVDVLNLGTKSPLKCIEHENKQKYPIRNAIFEEDICSTSLESIVLNNYGIKPPVFYSVVVILSLMVLALATGMSYVLYTYKGCRPCINAQRFF